MAPAVLPTRLRTLASVGLLTAIGMLVPVSARADFDKALVTEVGPAVVKYLKDNGCHCVGVLQFRVRRGDKDLFQCGPICDNMVSRLQNALIYCSSEEDGLSLLSDLSGHASKLKKGVSYCSSEGREQLLSMSCPTLWGSDSSKPDCCLTGYVTLKPGKACLVVQAFSQKSKELSTVCSCDVSLDSTIAAEMGTGFSSVKSLGIGDQDDGSMPVEVTITYNGKAQQLTSDAGTKNEFTIAEPQEKQELAIGIKNISKDRADVVLLVNGMNTRYKQTGMQPVEYKKWVLDPTDNETYKGFYGAGDECEPFVVLSDAETKKLLAQEDLSPRLGTIEVFVFREGKPGEKVDTEERPFSLGMRAKPSKRPSSFTEARSMVKGAMSQSLGAVAAGAPTGKENFTRVKPFENPQLVSTMVIRYYHPKAKKVAD